MVEDGVSSDVRLLRSEDGRYLAAIEKKDIYPDFFETDFSGRTIPAIFRYEENGKGNLAYIDFIEQGTFYRVPNK